MNQKVLPCPSSLSTPDSPPISVAQPSRDGQAQASAAIAARGRRIALFELGEQPRQVHRVDARAAVLHLEADQYLLPIALQRPRADADVAALGELGRVGRVVEHRLAQPRRVADQPVRRVGVVDFDRQALGLRLFRDQRAHLVEHGRQREVHMLQAQLPGFDLRQVEDVVDDREQVPRGVVDLGHAVALLGVERAALQQPRHAEHGVHRRADLVAHVGQELALGAVGAVGRIARLGERGVQHLQLALCLLQFGDLVHQHEEAHHLAAAPLGHIVHPGVVDAAVAAELFALEHLGLARQHSLDSRQSVGQQLLAQHALEVAADHLVLTLAQPVEEALVGVAAAQFAVPVDHAARHVLGDRATELLGAHQLGVALAQPQLGLFDRRDVGLHDEKAVHLAVAPVGHVVRVEVAHLALLVGQRALDLMRLAGEHRFDHRPAAGVLLVAEHVAHIQADHLLAAAAEPGAVGGVGEFAEAVAVPIGHHAGQRVGHPLNEIFAPRQLGAALTHLVFKLLSPSLELGFELPALGAVGRGLGLAQRRGLQLAQQWAQRTAHAGRLLVLVTRVMVPPVETHR